MIHIQVHQSHHDHHDQHGNYRKVSVRRFLDNDVVKRHGYRQTNLHEGEDDYGNENHTFAHYGDYADGGDLKR